MTVIHVALDVPIPTLFDYAAEQQVKVGQRVRVPFGRREQVGVVMACDAAASLESERIKPILSVLDETPLLPQDVLEMCRFCSEYYLYPLGPVVMAALPARLRSGQPFEPAHESWFGLSASGRALDPGQFPGNKRVQRRVLSALQQGTMSTAQIRTLAPGALAALRALQKAGWVEPGEPQPPSGTHAIDPCHVLTAEQQQAVDDISQCHGYTGFLLLGVTGSGKTEVYARLMQQALLQGRQVLMLVPEITLTPQLELYFRSRFPHAEMVSLHSGLADTERARNWMSAQSGRARIVIGTRLAVFTPMPQLGMVIVDEEHDASFKQQEGLRYSARDVAVFRARQRDIPIVMGSATPSLETYHNAKCGRYRLLRLTRRAAEHARLPGVHCIDTTRSRMQQGISEPLLKALSDRLQRGEQSLLFINRRGYSPVLMCTACGWLSGCRNCAGKLVLHLADRQLRCHHCGHREPVPLACPSCGNADLQAVGTGTQRIESTLREHFPHARILRVDRDSTRKKGAWPAMLQQIRGDEVDILVGTQMLSKGHDFPNLTLTGIVNPDSALYSSDFRGPEKLFSQLAQVAGRAGRAGLQGEVLIQTAFPDHPLFAALRNHDYEGWAATLLAERQSAGFPPFEHQAMLRAEGRQRESVYAFLNHAQAAAMVLAMPVEVYDAVPAALPKRASQVRAQLLVQSASRRALQQFLHAWQPALGALPQSKLRWTLDIDPLEF